MSVVSCFSLGATRRFADCVRLAASHGAYYVLEGTPLAAALLVTVYIESAIAAFCLWGLICGDPGVVRRTEESCFPLPDYLKHQYRMNRVELGQPLGEVGAGRNIEDKDHGTYCVRCMVWRDPAGGKADIFSSWLTQHGCAFCCDYPPKRAHHCRTCQRCVLDFDHHCGIFGRCIAGRGFAGNMGYFKVIITTGSWGSLTAGAGVVYAVTDKMGWSGLGWAILGLFLLSCVWNMVFCAIRMSQRVMRERRRAEQRQNGGETSDLSADPNAAALSTQWIKTQQGGGADTSQPSETRAPVEIATQTNRGEDTNDPLLQLTSQEPIVVGAGDL